MAPQLTSAPASILLVDDNPANLLALETILRPLGQELVRAESGTEALRQLLKRQFALILMDIRMPDLGGFETAELIRLRPQSELTPIIFMTAFERAQVDMVRGYALGGVDFIFAPVVPDVLRAKVAVFVSLYQQAQELRRLEEQRRRQAEARFSSLLEIAGDAVIVVDGDGSILLFSRGADQIFGQEAGGIVGQPLELLVPGGRPPVGSGEVTGRRLSGEEFPAEVSVSKLSENGREVYILILRDVSERKRSEAEVTRLNDDLSRRLRAGVDMVADLAGTLDPREVLGRLLARAVTAVQANHGRLLRIEGGKLVVEASCDGSGRMLDERRLPPPALPLVERAMRDGAPVLAGRVAVLPLLAGESVAALLVLSRRRDRPFDPGSLETMQLIGNVALVALRNAQLFVEAQQASRAKTDFLNMAAHELRTPLSVVIGYLSMLGDGTLGEPPAAWTMPIEVLNAKAAELNKLVDDLLTAARLEAAQIPARSVEFDLRESVRQAASRARPLAVVGGGKIVTQLPEAEVRVQADPDHVARILDNLVSNALAYTVNRPWVRVTAVPGGRVTVEDHGVGIPAGDRERIFERFFRLDHPEVGPQPGTGLGLYISRQLAERHQGTLELEKSGASGSVFTLRLPATKPAAAAEVSGEAKTPLEAV